MNLRWTLFYYALESENTIPKSIRTKLNTTPPDSACSSTTISDKRFIVVSYNNKILQLSSIFFQMQTE